MSDIETLLYTRLSGYAGLSALADARIYPMLLPQGATLPALTYQRVSGVQSYSHQGDSGLATVRMQVDCWGATYASAKAVAAQVKAALSGYTSSAIGRCHLGAERDLYDPETGRYRVIIDFMVGYRE
jgi:hypothetical protein